MSKHSRASFLAEHTEHTGPICRDTPTPYGEACAVRVTLDGRQKPNFGFHQLAKGEPGNKKIKTDNMLELIANDSV